MALILLAWGSCLDELLTRYMPGVSCNLPKIQHTRSQLSSLALRQPGGGATFVEIQDFSSATAASRHRQHSHLGASLASLDLTIQAQAIHQRTSACRMPKSDLSLKMVRSMTTCTCNKIPTTGMGAANLLYYVYETLLGRAGHRDISDRWCCVERKRILKGGTVLWW